MPSIVVLTDAFPPVRSGRAEKSWRRAKYLARDGWDVTVLTPHTSEGAAPAEELSEVVGATTRIRVLRTGYLLSGLLPSLRQDRYLAEFRTKTRLGRLLSPMIGIGVGYLRWLPSAVSTAASRVRDCDVVLSFSNPVMLHLAGFAVAKRLKVPWAAEVRDQIYGYAYNVRGTEYVNRMLERWIVTHADLVIEWADALDVSLAERYVGEPRHKFFIAKGMGYDPDRYLRPDCGEVESDVLSLTFTGSTYGTSIQPSEYLRGVAEFVRRSGIGCQEIRIDVAGDWRPELDQLIEDLGLRGYVRVHGRVPPDRCVELWRRSSMLVLILGDERDNRSRIPSKYWDYLGTKKPILCIGPEDAAVSKEVRSERLGFTCANDASIIADRLAMAHSMWRAGASLPSVGEASWEASSCVGIEAAISRRLKLLSKEARP